MQRRALLGGERPQHLVFDASQPLFGGLEFADARGGQFDDVPPAVGRVAAAADEAALFEVVEQTHDVARIELQRLGKPLLSRVAVVAQQHESYQVARAQAIGGPLCLGGPAGKAGQMIKKRERMVGARRAGRARRRPGRVGRHLVPTSPDCCRVCRTSQRVRGCANGWLTTNHLWFTIDL